MLAAFLSLAVFLAAAAPTMPKQNSLRARWERSWVSGYNPSSRDAAYLGDTCDNTADCLVPHSVCEAMQDESSLAQHCSLAVTSSPIFQSVCKPAGNRAWRQQMFCVCRGNYHPLTGYCEKDRDYDGEAEVNATTTADPPVSAPEEQMRLSEPPPPPAPSPRPRPRPRIRPTTTGAPRLEDLLLELPLPARPRRPPSLRVQPISNHTQRLISQVVKTLAEASRRHDEDHVTNPYDLASGDPDYVFPQPQEALLVSSHIGQSIGGRLVDPGHHGYDTHDLETSSAVPERPIKYFYETGPDAPPTTPAPVLAAAVAAISKDEMKTLIQEAAEAAIRKYLASMIPPPTAAPAQPFFLEEEATPPEDAFPNLFQPLPRPVPRITYRGPNRA